MTKTKKAAKSKKESVKEMKYTPFNEFVQGYIKATENHNEDLYIEEHITTQYIPIALKKVIVLNIVNSYINYSKENNLRLVLPKLDVEQSIVLVLLREYLKIDLPTESEELNTAYDFFYVNNLINKVRNKVLDWDMTVSFIYEQLYTEVDNWNAICDSNADGFTYMCNTITNRTNELINKLDKKLNSLDNELVRTLIKITTKNFSNIHEHVNNKDNDK